MVHYAHCGNVRACPNRPEESPGTHRYSLVLVSSGTIVSLPLLPDRAWLESSIWVDTTGAGAEAGVTTGGTAGTATDD